MPAFPLTLATSLGNVGGRYLVDQNGTPFFFAGDSAWSCATTLSPSDIDAYLAGASARGVTAILVNAIDNEFNNGATYGSVWGSNYNGDFPFSSKQGGGSYTNAQTQSPDFTTPNTSGTWWSTLDHLVSKAATYGILVIIYPFWIGNPINDPTSEGYYNALSSTSSANRQSYGAFIANRYKSSSNVIYFVGGDNDQTNGANVPSITNDIVTGIQSVDTSKLFSFDCLDGNSPLTQTTTWGANFIANSTTKAIAGLNNVYTDVVLSHPYPYVNCQNEWTRADFPRVPYIFKEGMYQNGQAGWTAQGVRMQMWVPALQGACGFFWGSNPAWFFGTGWQTDYSSSRASLDATVAFAFFKRRRWDLLIPDVSNLWLTNGGSYTNANFAAASLAIDGSWGAIYVPVNESLIVNLGAMHGTVTAYWTDPTNGSQTVAGQFSASGSHTFASTPGSNAAGDADWVLEIRGAAPSLSRWIGSV